MKMGDQMTVAGGTRLWSMANGARALYVRIVVIAAVLPLVAACASSSQEERLAAPVLEPGAWTEAALHCRKDACENLYQLVMGRGGSVKVTVNAPADPALPDFTLELQDRDGHVIAEDRELMKRPRNVTRGLAPGLYLVSIKGRGTRDDRLSYKVRYDVVTKTEVKKARPSPPQAAPKSRPKPPPPPPPPPPPTTRWIASEILEVERQGGEPVAVLLEAGTSDGLKPGLKGELVDGGQPIAVLEVVDVYAEGSRARIVGALTAPITLDTTARIAP